MNNSIQKKIEQYKRMANSHTGNASSTSSRNTRNDSLAQVIRSKKDADDFMAELESAAKRSR